MISLLQGKHLAGVRLVVVAAEVEHAVDGRLDDVARCARGRSRRRRARAARRLARRRRSGTRGRRWARRVPRWSRLSSLMRSASTSSTERWPSLDARRRSSAASARRELGRNVGEVDQPSWLRSRSACSS